MNWTGVRNGQRRMDYVRYCQFFGDVYFRNKMKILNHRKDEFSVQKFIFPLKDPYNNELGGAGKRDNRYLY